MADYTKFLTPSFDALRLTPDNSVARSFLSWLHTQGLIPKQYALEARSFLGQRRPEDLLGEAQEEDSAQEHREASSGESDEGVDSASADGCNTTLDYGSTQEFSSVGGVAGQNARQQPLH